LGNDTDTIRYHGGSWEVSDDDGATWTAATSQPAFSATDVGMTTDAVYTINGIGLDDAGGAAFTPSAFAGITTAAGGLASQDGTGNAATFFYGENGGQSVTVKQAKTVSLSALIGKTTVADQKNGGGAVQATLISSGDVEAAISEVDTTRAGYGALQNQLEHASNNMATTKENLQSAESRVRDVDMAEEMTTYTKNNILLQASQAMLAQANSQPQGVLQLLQ
jgi:flagellin